MIDTVAAHGSEAGLLEHFAAKILGIKQGHFTARWTKLVSYMEASTLFRSFLKELSE